MIDEKQLITIGPFTKGVNNMTNETALGPDELRVGRNISLDASGGVDRRGGYTEVVIGTNTHSLRGWSGELVFVENGTMTRLDPVSTVKTPVLDGLNPARYVSYSNVRGALYWTNGEQSGKLSKIWENSPWAVPNPPVQPTLSTTASGALEPGKYQVAITYVDRSGEESGTGVAAEISGGGGVVLSGIPSPGAGYFVRVYMTPPNGDQFFEQAQLTNGTSSYTIYAFNDKGIPLETQYKRPIPPGQIIRFAFGRLWVARDNLLLFSEPQTPGLYQPNNDFFMFRDRITVMEPVVDGIWIATLKEIKFIQGTVPSAMTVARISDEGGIEGTGITVHASKFNIDLPVEVAYWFGDQGGMIGMPGGQIKPFMEGRVAVDHYERGATILRQEDGVQQIITAVRGNALANRVQVSDVAEGYIRRNGIIIQQ